MGDANLDAMKLRREARSLKAKAIIASCARSSANLRGAVASADMYPALQTTPSTAFVGGGTSLYINFIGVPRP
jgi:phosphoribosylcarboxyaminoimidazole (NCAIR) mutase